MQIDAIDDEYQLEMLLYEELSITKQGNDLEEEFAPWLVEKLNRWLKQCENERQFLIKKQ
jgi:hypothetical protein